MEISRSTGSNLIETILNLPAELQRMILAQLLPATIRFGYGSNENYYNRTVRRRTSSPVLLKSRLFIRLKYTETFSSVLNEGIFYLSDHVITKAWYAVVRDFLQTTTVWDLGDMTALRNFLDAGRTDIFESRILNMLQYLRKVQHTAVTVITTGPEHLHMMERLLAEYLIMNGALQLTIARIHLADLSALEDFESVWNLIRAMFTLATTSSISRLHAADTKSNLVAASQHAYEARLTCPYSAFQTRKIQSFIHTTLRYAGVQSITWVPSGISCRYQGALGDIVIKWDQDCFSPSIEGVLSRVRRLRASLDRKCARRRD